MTVIDLSGRTPAQRQGLLSQLVVPRPIAMITTISPKGVTNVAPFSYYMPVCGEPPTIAITIGTRKATSDDPKDTWANLQDTGEFVINLTTHAIRDHIEAAAREYPEHVNEADVAGWSYIPSQVVAPPSLAESSAHMECVVREVITRGDLDLPFSGVHIILAEVLCIVVDDEITEGPNRIDSTKLDVVGRMGLPYFTQVSVDSIFVQERIAYQDLPAEMQFPLPDDEEGVLASGSSA
jgi:flavin reductase (DIM6/NTAB) family NADH-FMN oxidoreductase RutF